MSDLLHAGTTSWTIWSCPFGVKLAEREIDPFEDEALKDSFAQAELFRFLQYDDEIPLPEARN